MPASIGGVNHPIDTDTYDPTGTTAGSGDLGKLASSVAQKAADAAGVAEANAKAYADARLVDAKAYTDQSVADSGTSGSVTAAQSGGVLTITVPDAPSLEG